MFRCAKNELNFIYFFTRDNLALQTLNKKIPNYYFS